MCVAPALLHSTDITVNYCVNGLLGTIFYISVMMVKCWHILEMWPWHHRWDQVISACSLKAGTQWTHLCGPSFQLF